MIERGRKENVRCEYGSVYVHVYHDINTFQNLEIVRIVLLFKCKLHEGSLYLLSL